MTIEQLQGAWRIEEAPRPSKRDHPYGFPNSHWLFLGDRGLVIQNQLPSPLCFDFRVHLDDAVEPRGCWIVGKHGGSGYYEVDKDLLFIALGSNGVRPPRFAKDCGDFFAFTRDPDFPVPAIPSWPRTDITSETLGTLAWDYQQPEYMGSWVGNVELSDGSTCEIWVSDYLIPLGQTLPTLERTYQWLLTHFPEVQQACAERVHDWVDEDEAFSHLTLEQLPETILVNAISASDTEIQLWAGTTIPIDHSIRVWLDVREDLIAIVGTSIEG